MHSSPVALVVSADRHLRRLLAVSLDQIGCLSLDVATSREGLECVEAGRVDVLIVDLSVDAQPERALVRRLRAEQRDLKVLYLIDRVNSEFGRLPGMRSDAYLRKPFRLQELRDVVSSWLYDGSPLLRSADLSMN